MAHLASCQWLGETWFCAADCPHHVIVDVDQPRPSRTITMQTFILDDTILYTVIDGDSDHGDHGDAVEVWRKEIPLGHRAVTRAGGYLATAAAREQEQIARDLTARRKTKP